MPQKVALITGVSSGIGRATTLAFIEQGIHVAGIARRAARLRELEREALALPQPRGDFLPIVASVTDSQSMQAAAQQTLDQFGRLDILVANAGVGHRGSLADSEWSELETLLRTNIDGVLHSIRATVPAMRQSGGGHIITISSVAYNLVAPYTACYAASKAFVSSIAHSLRLELESDHIRVTDVIIGRTQSEFNRSRMGKGARAQSNIPVMTAEEVAAAIVRTISRQKRTLFVRLLDRLTVWANRLMPDRIGRIAMKQYR